MDPVINTTGSPVRSGFIQPGFMVLQSNRLEHLRRVTVEWLGRNPLQPLENEILLVQSNGIAQWLKLALAADADADEPGCGIAAALNISLPGRFHWQAYRAVLGNLPETSPYDKQLLSWRLLRLLPTLLAEPEFAALQHFLQDDRKQRKQFQLAQRLADLLDQYQIYRADWLQDWAQGINRITGNNAHVALPDQQSWQAALWRRLIEDIAPAERLGGRAQVHQQFLDACTSLTPETRPAALPRRVVVFGLSSLPRQSLEVLAAIARCTQVLLCVHNPCAHYWGDIIDPQMAQRLFSKPYKRQAPRPDMPLITGEHAADELFLRGNPLLAAWGKQGRDYIRLLDEHDERAAYEQYFTNNKLDIDLFEAPAEDHLLGRIQSDIFHLRSLAEATENQQASDTGSKTDTSLSFHIAHSAQREVEVLQDHLLRLFNANTNLRPRDVLVMVPDINQFAPHIQAVFGRINRSDTRYIPYTISDQGRRHQVPVYQALSMLMNLTASRFGVSELLDLMDVPAFQEAFALDSADKTLLHRWVEGAGIRWGLNGEQRIAQGLPSTLSHAALDQNTWHFGLRRMLLGYAVGNGDAWQDIEPFAEVGGLSAAVTGKLSHLLHVLEDYWHLFQQPTDVSGWTQRIRQLLNQCFIPQDDADTLLLSRAEKCLDGWLDACNKADFHDPLPVDIVAEYFLDALDENDLSQRFMAGTVNFATLMPMRAIPFRHICLLGMNDGDYPRQVPAVDFDLMRHDYRPGDRSRREDDRYLFLEALLSARDSLYISWAGRNIRDNSERPPSVLVAQLRDYVADSCSPALLSSLTREYPLQPFSDQYFNADSSLTTYAHEWEPESPAGADTFDTPATPDAPDSSMTTAAHPADMNILSLRDLVALLRNPPAVFFAKQLGIVFDDEELTGDDNELFKVDGLTRWQIMDSVLGDVRSTLGQHPSADIDMTTLLEQLIDNQQRSGALPIPPFGELQRTDLTQPLIKPLQRYQQLLTDHSGKTDLLVDLPPKEGAPQLQDMISDIRYNPDQPDQRIRCVLFSSQIWQGKQDGRGEPKWHYLVRQWPLHLAAQLSGPVTTHLLGPATEEKFAPLAICDAQLLLQQLLQLWQQNLQQPLSAEVKTSCKFLTTTGDKKPADEAAQIYDGGFNHRGVVQQSYVLYRLWPAFTDLLETPDADDSKFVRDSTALYHAMIDHWQKYRQAATRDTEDAS